MLSKKGETSMKTKKRNKVVALLMIMVMVLSMAPVSPIKASAAEMPQDFKVVGPADFGIATGEMKAESKYTENGGGKKLATWDEVLFRMSIKADKIPIVFYDTTITFGNYGWDGTGSYWKLNTGGTETALSSVTAIGEDSFLNHEFELAISTEILNLDEDSEQDDLQIGIWFDGTLYNNQYLSIFDYTVNYKDTGHWARVDANMGTTLTITDPTRQMPDDFTIVGPEDFGLPTGNLYSESAKSYGASKTIESWDEVLFKMTIKTDKIFNMYYDYASVFCNVGTDESLWKFNYNGLTGGTTSWFEITAQNAIGEDTFTNHEFELALSTDIMDIDRDGWEDDLRFGIWFNGELYNDAWLDIIDYTERHTDANHLVRLDAPAGSTVTIKGQPKERQGVSVEEVNTGDMNRVSYNNPDLYVDINFGFQAWPVVVDYDEDGILDIMLWGGDASAGADMVYYGTEEGSINMETGVSLGRNTEQPFNPTYLYNENGTYKTTLLHIWGKGNAYEAKNYPENVINEAPYYSIPAMTGNGQELIADEITGSGKTIHHTLADYDNDGVLDFIRSFESWAEYAWGTEREGRYDENGIWGGVGNTELAEADGTNDTSEVKDGDPLHGYVRWYKNTGTNESFAFDSTKDHVMVYDYEVVENKKVAIEETATRLDVYGAPSPMFNDWDGDGDLDIICGDFADRFYYFENIADVATMKNADYTPVYVNARTDAGEKDRMLKQQVGDTLDKNNLVDCELFCIQMQPSAFDWDGDGHKDIIVGDEDGRVYFIKNTGALDAEGTPIFEAPAPFQTKAGVVDFSTLPSIDSVDWDGDGDEDIVFSEDSGYIGILPNLTIEKGGDLTNPIWGKQVRLTNEDGEVFRLTAGYNGSIQGPSEEKLGYVKLSVGDWDGDGVYDIISNNTWGIVMFHKGIKTDDISSSFQACDPEPIIVEWSAETLAANDGCAPHPAWNWWNPGKEPLNKAYTKEETHCLDYAPALSSTWNGNPNELVIQWRMNTCMIDLPLLDEDGDGVATGDGLMDLVVADHEGYLSFFERYEEDGVLKLKEGKRIFTGSADGTAYRVRDQLNGNAGRQQYLLADYNGDGKLDYIQNDGFNAQVRLNLATEAGKYVFDSAENWSHYVHNREIAGHSTCPTTCDWDQDGKLELLVTSEGGILHYLNQNRMPEDFTVIGPEDYGISTGTLYGADTGDKDYGWSKSLDTLDKVLFKMTIKQNDEGKWYLFMTSNICIFPLDGNAALKFQYAGLCGATGWYEIYASQALGTTTFVGQEYELAISTEYVDNDGDGSEDDLKMGIWINECLYRSKYYYFTDYTEGNYSRTNALRLSGGAASSMTVTSSTEEMPKFVEETFSSCGIADGTVVKGTLGASLPDATSLDELLLTGILNPEETTEFVYPLGGDASLNIRMRDDGVLEVVPSGVSDGIWFYDKLYKTFDVGGAPAALGVGKTAFMNEEYEFTISTEYVNYDNEGTKENDLKIGLWFNGKLYGNEYFYLKNCTDKLGTDFEIRSGSEKGVTVASPDLYPFKEFTRVTSGDFGVDGTYNATTTGVSNIYATVATGRLSDRTTMDKVLAETTITLTHSCEMRYLTDLIDIYIKEEQIEFYEMGKWGSLNDSEGWIVNGTIVGGKKVFYPSTAIGETTFSAKPFRLSFTTEYVDLDEDGADDLKLGVWFDGKLYDDAYLYLKNYVSNVAPKWNIQTGSDGTNYNVTLASVSGLETVMAPVITDSIEMQYQVVPNNFVQQMGSPKVTITVGDEVNVSAKVSVEDHYYTFSYPGIMVQDMDQTVTATITAGNYTEVYAISMLDYCEKMLEKEASELENAAETKDLIVDLVQYASAVQTYRGVSGEDLLTSKLEARVSGYESFDTDDADASALAGLTVVEKENKLTGENDSDAYKWKNVSLVIGNKVKIRARLTATDVSNLTVKATINGEEQEVDIIATSENGVYMIDFSDIRAYEYDETVTFKFYEGTQQVGETLSYSVNTYLNAKRDYSGAKAEELKALLLAIHNYGTEAKAYQSLSAQ